MTFTITNVTGDTVYSSGYSRWYFTYELHEPNGAIYRVKRLWGEQPNPFKWDYSSFPTYNAALHQKGISTSALSSEKADHGKQKRDGNYRAIVEKKLIRPANPSPSPTLTTAANQLQKQIDITNRANQVLQQTVARQSQEVVALREKADRLTATINALNGTISELQAQVAVIPSLQNQISVLEQQVSALTVTLREILALL